MSASGTIIIPAHNEQHFIIGLLESLKKHLKNPTQIIVVANACTDSTVQTAQDYGCEVIETTQKQYPSTARNIGVKHANGDIFAFLDADVEVTEKWCSTFHDLLDSESGDSLILTGDQYHISKTSSWIENNWFLPLRQLPKGYINGGNLIVSRELFNRIDGFDSNLETGEDVDFCNRAKQASAELIINPSFVTLHEGFPKTIGHFVRRERWHGKGDFQQLKKFTQSKTAIATVIFTFIHFFLFFSLATALLQNSKTNLLITIIPIITIALLIAAASCMRFKSLSVLHRPNILAIQYIYFVGRALSFLDTIKTFPTRLSEK